MKKQVALILLILAVAFEVISDVLFKKWSMENKSWLLFVGLSIYAFGTLLWAFSLKGELLSKAIVIFTILNLVGVVLIGIFFFKEHLTIVQKIGILLGIVAVVLVES